MRENAFRFAIFHSALAFLLALTLSACGGKSGGGSSGTTSGANPTRHMLIVQPGISFWDPSYVSRISSDTHTVEMTVQAAGMAIAVLADPDQASFWMSVQGTGVERRALSDGSLLDTVAYTSAKDMVYVPSLNRIYVAGYESIGVIDVSTRVLVVTIPLGVSDQTVGIAVSPDGSEIVVGATTGSTVDLVFVSTATNEITQRLPTGAYSYDMIHLGDRLVTWNDNADEFRTYEPAPWAEVIADRVTIGSDGSASYNAFHNMQYNPIDGHVYIFRSSTATVLRFDPYAPTTYTALAIASPYMCLSLDPDGQGLLGVTYPATGGMRHLALPSGPETATTYDLSMLPAAACMQLENV